MLPDWNEEQAWRLQRDFSGRAATCREPERKDSGGSARGYIPAARGASKGPAVTSCPRPHCTTVGGMSLFSPVQVQAAMLYVVYKQLREQISGLLSFLSPLSPAHFSSRLRVNQHAQQTLWAKLRVGGFLITYAIIWL